MPRRRPEPLAGRTAVITGAASGIGRALARRLAAAGCPVAIADVDEHGLKETAAGLDAVLSRTLDVRDAAAVSAFAADVRDWSPRPLGAVFNNAGVATGSSVLDAVADDDAWLHEINFHGVVHGVRAFLPILVAQDSGAMVNTSSVYGLIGVPHQSAYCAAKFAVRGFTEALRAELRGTGVRAVTVHPGGVKTNIAHNARFHGDPEGRGRSHRQIADEFVAAALTTPERAAAIIHKGVDQGRARILVGPDARLIDTVARISPTHAYAVLDRVRSFVARR